MKNKNYKLFILMSFLLLGGCTTKHKNVVTGVGTIDSRPILLLEDVEDKKERIFYISALDEYEHGFTYLDDTVNILINPARYDKNERFYQINTVFEAEKYGIRFNNDSIRARRNRRDAYRDSIYVANQYKELEHLKQQIKPSPQNIK